MNQKPLGRPIHYCTACGGRVVAKQPEMDTHLRYVCSECALVHYENPKIVVGCVPVHEDRILMCRRAIEPRYGFWTLPAGFMELGESLAVGAARETREEACAEVSITGLLAIVNVLSAGQVHVYYRAKLHEPRFAAGEESLDVRLVAPDEIPWEQLAFTSNRIALEQHLYQHERGAEYVYNCNAL